MKKKYSKLDRQIEREGKRGRRSERERERGETDSRKKKLEKMKHEQWRNQKERQE